MTRPSHTPPPGATPNHAARKVLPPAPGAPLLAVDDLAVHAGAQVLLQGVSFQLHAGQALSLVGESGAGKSLLAQAILGQLPTGLRATGTVTVAGIATRAQDTRARRALWGRQLALVPQEPSIALNPLRRVLPQQAEVYTLLHGHARARAFDQARRALADAGLGMAMHHYPWQLSGGMAQRAVTAMALASQAPVLMADEPTKGLDRPWRDQAVQTLGNLLSHGGCVLVITHDLAVAQALGGQVIVLREGQVVEHGPVDAVMQAPQHAFTRRLLAADPAHWPQWSTRAGSSEVVHHGSEPLLDARQISKYRAGRPLFADLDLQVRAGERLAVQGPSGVGKSTLGNVLLGLEPPDAGRVLRHPSLRPHALQKLYQDPVASLPPQVPLGQLLRDTARLHGVRWTEVEQRLHALRLSPALLARLPAQVSGGELQRMALARVLMAQPALLFADEPTSRLDPISQHEALQVLCQAIDEVGAALVLVTHDEALANAVGTRTLRLSAPPQELVAPAVPAAPTETA